MTCNVNFVISIFAEKLLGYLIHNVPVSSTNIFLAIIFRILSFIVSTYENYNQFHFFSMDNTIAVKVLNDEHMGAADKNTGAKAETGIDIIKELRISMTNLKANFIDDQTGRIDYIKMISSSEFSVYRRYIPNILPLVLKLIFPYLYITSNLFIVFDWHHLICRLTYGLCKLSKNIANEWEKDERKAFFINLYNCLMIDALAESSAAADGDGQQLPSSPLKVI